MDREKLAIKMHQHLKKLQRMYPYKYSFRCDVSAMEDLIDIVNIEQKLSAENVIDSNKNTK